MRASGLPSLLAPQQLTHSLTTALGPFSFVPPVAGDFSLCSK
jgi:hypothetical protein